MSEFQQTVADGTDVGTLLDELHELTTERAVPTVLTACMALLFTAQYPQITPTQLQEGISKTSVFIAHLIETWEQKKNLIIPASRIN